MESQLILGTGTGVGKTWASAWLCRRGLGQGRRTAYLKPVQTGCGDLPGDAEWVRARCGASLLPGCLELASPYRFPLAASPHLAAREAGVEAPGIAEVASAIAALVEVAAPELLIVESAGGVASPLRLGCTMGDLAAALRLPVVLVASPGLGTLSATATALEYLKNRGVIPAGLIVSGCSPQPDLVEADNLRLLEEMAAPGFFEKLMREDCP
ncbi:MAG: hypothetical protein RL095_2110 [Verrucomicrobiota bacterium]|jgi:dethiobiotin synthetase